jgi:hypothetical protein
VIIPELKDDALLADIAAARKTAMRFIVGGSVKAASS